MNHLLLSTVYADDDTGFSAVSLRDESWEEATELIKQAFVEGFRTLLFDDGVLLFKEDVATLQQHGVKGDQEPVFYGHLGRLLDGCQVWWSV